MHLTRSEVSRVALIPRKGTTYIARPQAYTRTSITVLAAVRDLLHLAQTAREVKEMIKEKKLKINGRIVRDYHESLPFLSLFEADKLYSVEILPTGRFTLTPVKATHRIAKVVNKKMLRTGVIQINLHEGTNFLSKEKVNIGDSVEIDTKGKITRIIPLHKGSSVVVRMGRNVGAHGTVSRREGNVVHVHINGQDVALRSTQVVAL